MYQEKDEKKNMKEGSIGEKKMEMNKMVADLVEVKEKEIRR